MRYVSHAHITSCAWRQSKPRRKRRNMYNSCAIRHVRSPQYSCSTASIVELRQQARIGEAGLAVGEGLVDAGGRSRPSQHLVVLRPPPCTHPLHPPTPCIHLLTLEAFVRPDLFSIFEGKPMTKVVTKHRGRVASTVIDGDMLRKRRPPRGRSVPQLPMELWSLILSYKTNAHTHTCRDWCEYIGLCPCKDCYAVGRVYGYPFGPNEYCDRPLCPVCDHVCDFFSQRPLIVCALCHSAAVGTAIVP